MSWRKLCSVAVLSIVGINIPGAKGQDLPPVPGESAAPSVTLEPAAAPASSRWPVLVSTSVGDVTVFQPQLEDFGGDTLKARAAVSVLQPGAQTPIFGAVWLQSRVATDRVARTVQILDVQITQEKFPITDQPTLDALSDSIRQVFAGHNVTLSLDQLLTMLETVHQENSAAEQLQTAPPRIIFLEHPAVKVQYDGKPRLAEVANSNLLRVINTPFFVILDPTSRTYFLKGGGRWFAAPDPLGPFQDARGVPPEITALADTYGYKDPVQPLPSAQAESVEIVTATEPTELICTDGPSQMATIPGTNLLYVANTDSDLFVTIDTQQFYVLLSGRWYTAPSHNGPWTFVPPGQLPADFARIPADSDKSNVLADVPGTQQAQDALADLEIPQTAAVDLHQFDQPPVKYDGDPDFELISGTSFSYAVNSDASVLFVDGRYYTCYNAVWYDSGSPQGPWGIAIAVPPEIYTIPPSCPIYPVRFCYVYGHTADVVYEGYLPGYVGCYGYDGVVVYGTGWNYAPWIRTHYYPRPFTYGFAARYNWYAGHWGFDFAASLGGGRAWIGVNPGRWVRSGGVWFGYGGFRPVFAHDAAHLTFAQREIAFDPSHRDAYFRNVYDHRTDVHREVIGGPVGRGPTGQIGQRPEDRAAIAAPRGPSDDVYAGRDGAVYRRTDTGWEVRDQNQWKPTDEPNREAPPADRRPVDQTPRDQSPRDQGPQGQAPRDQAPRDQSPRGQSPRQAQPSPQPRQPEPSAPDRGNQRSPAENRPAAPAAPPRDGGLNGDYQARQRGQERGNEAPAAPPAREPSPPPAPRQPSPPPQSPPRQGGPGNGVGGAGRNRG